MIKKYILLTIGSITTLLGGMGGFAMATSYQYDCGIVANSTDSSKILGSYVGNTILDTNTATLALKHLATYCCKKGFLDGTPTCGDQAIINDKGGAESPFLFDHFIDLGFRRLDAIDNPELRYGLDADPTGLTWQKKLTEFGDVTKKIKPQDVVQSYTDIRQGNSKKTILNTYSNCIIDGFGDLALAQKYKATCQIASCITQQIPNPGAFNSSDTSAGRLGSYDPCNDLAANRVNTETAYVRQLLVRVGIRAITNVVDQYTQNYFVGTRRQDLYENFATFDQALTSVNHKIQEGTPTCSK